MSDTLNRSIRTIDLQIRIAEHYGFAEDFREKIRQSDSNSMAALYFDRTHLSVIAEEMGVEDLDEKLSLEVRNAIREACGCEPRSVRGYDWVELRAIIQTAEIPIEDDCQYDLSAIRRESTSHTNSKDSTQDRGPWADWSKTGNP